ncbi:Serine/threonine-protein phosphatase 2A activator 1 [Lecanora helva]
MDKSESPANAPSLQIIDNTQPCTFIKPQKKIHEGHDVSNFLVSTAYGDIMTFLLQLNRAMFPCSVQNPLSKTSTIQSWELDSAVNLYVSDTVKKLVELLKRLDAIIDEIPPDPGPRRFGNASFRTWYQAVDSRIGEMLSSHLPENILSFPHANEVTAINEIEAYLLGSFGSAQRLDYGSGHELSFLAFLGCIWKLGGFHSQPSPPGNSERAIVLYVISTYLSLIRRLIKTYTLEPAGSHGVWGLDDHSFIPYIFGSAQYGPAISSISQQTPTEGSLDGAPDPGDVARIAAVDRERDKNLYFGAIGFIHDVKKGPFWEHSPMLYDISGVRAGWGKINKGMIKMYSAEILSKYPVVQHFPFGSLFSFTPDPNAPPQPPPSTISPHISNQPLRDLPSSSSSSLATAASRPAPPLGQSRMQQQPPPVSRPGLGNATKAPWASNGPGGAREVGGRVLPTRAPPPPRSAKVEKKGSDATNDDGKGTSMPPPTRAPWAKPP